MNGKVSRERSVGASERLQRCIRERARGTALSALAARQPGGSAWRTREVPMWKRSEVEKLTGLTRHMIQDLCNPNTSRDGLGFWKPAVSKPGYSRFDEGDLLAFYLVRQLMKAGFTLREVGPVVYDMLEDGAAFETRIAEKATELRAHRAQCDAKLSTLRMLENTLPCAPVNRLFAVMDTALVQSMERSVTDASQELGVDVGEATQAAELLQDAVVRLLTALDMGAVQHRWMARGQDDPRRVDEKTCEIACLRESITLLRGRGVASTSHDATACVWHFAHMLACGQEEDSYRGCFAHDQDTRTALIVHALNRFLHETENGVPVELICGEGSFAYLAEAAQAAVDALSLRNQDVTAGAERSVDSIKKGGQNL